MRLTVHFHVSTYLCFDKVVYLGAKYTEMSDGITNGMRVCEKIRFVVPVYVPNAHHEPI